MENIDGREQCRESGGGSEIEVLIDSSQCEVFLLCHRGKLGRILCKVSKYNCNDHLNYVFTTFSNILKLPNFGVGLDCYLIWTAAGVLKPPEV